MKLRQSIVFSLQAVIPLAFSVAVLILFMPAALMAQLRIQSVSPAPDALDTGPAETIRVSFDRPLDQNSVGSRSIRVWGNLHGSYDGELSYESASNTMVFTLATSFIEGEEITAQIADDLRGLDGSTLAGPLIWRFWIATSQGTANFIPFDIPLASQTQEPTEVVPGDFDKDGFIDLAVLHRGSDRVSLLRNTFRETRGTNPTAEPLFLSTHATPVSGASGDFNQDGELDLAIVNFNGNSCQIFLGSGSMSFDPPRSFQVGERPSDVLAQDFDGDGDLDLAITLSGSDRVAIYRNDGAGSFADIQRLSTEASPSKSAAWDFDFDGDLDLAVANQGSQSISIFSNSGAGNLSASNVIDLPFSPVDLSTAEVSGSSATSVGDNQRELVVLCTELPFLGKSSTGGVQDLLAGQNAAQATSSSIIVLQYRPASSEFEAIQNIPFERSAASFTLCNVDTLDPQTPGSPFRPDRDLDLFFTSFWDNEISWLRNADNVVFSSSLATLDSVYTPKAITHFDFDRDGDNDVVATSYLPNKLIVYFNQGSRIPLCELADSVGASVSLIDFGQVLVGTSAGREFALRNPTSLEFLYATTVSDPSHFGVIPANGTLPPAQNSPVRIEFSPSDTLAYRATLVIAINDYLGESSSCAVVLEGRGIMPIIFLPEALIDFGCVPPEGTVVRQLRIENLGNATLVISNAATSTSIFAPLSNMSGLQILPHSFTTVPIAFRPDRLGTFADTLRIFSNDPRRPVATVLLRGCASNSGPEITSPDTLRATEDIEAIYVATAEDPDGTRPVFRFENLPSWLIASGDTVRGTPREGDRDTSFVIIASDGFFRDTLRVVVIVTPVNDAPVFGPLRDYTIYENERLSFEVEASDPEGSPITLAALNLPSGATFTALTPNRGAFNWQTAVGSAGNYTVTFVATEQVTGTPQSTRAEVHITVLARRPDLFITSLTVSGNVIRQNQPVRVATVFGDSLASVTGTILAGFFLDGQSIADTTLNGFTAGATIEFERKVVFPEAGRHRLEARIDVGNSIEETNENNNVRSIEVEVDPGKLTVVPNPFTPNGDGFNDEAVFDLRDLGARNPKLKIFDLRGNLVRTTQITSGSQFRWDGRDASGREQYPGPYLYLLIERDEKVASGYVVLAR